MKWKQLGKRTCHLPSLLLWVFLFAVGFQWCIDLFSKELHLTCVGETFSICRKTENICIKFTSYFIKNSNLSYLDISSMLQCQAPGLKRTMARRQPSSVLSICISLILLTSSVRTLNNGNCCKYCSEISKCEIKNEIMRIFLDSKTQRIKLPVKYGTDLCTLHTLPELNKTGYYAETTQI